MGRLCVISSSVSEHDQDATSAGSTYTIDIYGMIALLTPSSAAVVDFLSYIRRVFDDGTVRPGSWKTQRLPLCDHDFAGRLGMPAGLVPGVTSYLRSQGATVTVNDHREFGPQHTLNATVLANASPMAREMLLAMAKEPLGQLELPKRDVAAALVLICMAFPTAKIIVAVGTKRQARYYHHLLHKAFGQAVGIATGGVCNQRTRITVSSYSYLHGLQDKPTDILLLPDAISAAADTARYNLAHPGFDQSRVYAFVPPGLRIGPAYRLCLEAVSGPMIWRCTPEPAPVMVYSADVLSFPNTTGLEGLAWKREAYWRNDRRNDSLAAIASALVARDLAKLWTMGLMLDAREDILPQPGEAFDVLVLVESTEHGRQLLAKLPGWELVGGTEGEFHHGNNPVGRIITLVYATTHIIGAHALVRAGGNYPMDLGGYPGPKDKTPGETAILIDVADDFDVRARHAYQDRLRDYHDRGWHVTASARTVTSGTANTTANTPGHSGLINSNPGRLGRLSGSHPRVNTPVIGTMETPPVSLPLPPKTSQVTTHTSGMVRKEGLM